MGLVYLGLFFAALVVIVLIEVHAVKVRGEHRFRSSALHTEWCVRIDDEGNLRVGKFTECGCTIGADHWQDGEPYRG